MLWTLSHPDVLSLFDGCLGNNSDFALDLLELLALGEYAQANKLTRVLPVLGKKAVSQERDRRQCLQAMASPKENRVHVRMLKTASERDTVRGYKHPQKIELGLVTRKGDELWQALQGFFRIFVRGKPVYREQIEYAERKANRFKNLGCSGLAEEIEKSIDGFKVQVSECWHGFNRITLVFAAVILAKIHGYMMSTVSSHWETGDQKSCIKVPKKNFYDFCTGTELNTDFFHYQPRAYPAHWFDNIASAETKNLIAHLDHFPETSGKPIFDHFIVIVPGVKYPVIEHDDFYEFRLPNGEIDTFATADFAAEALDMLLVKEGFLHPVLLGERDGKCYFIDYWKGADYDKE